MVKDHSRKLVGLDATPDFVGDEPCLIVQSTGVPMAVGSNRQQTIELLTSNMSLTSLLVMMVYSIGHWHGKSNGLYLIEIVVWVIKNSYPKAICASPISRLEIGTVIEHATQPNSDLNMHLDVGEPYLLNPLYDQAVDFDPTQNYYAVVGIGFPQRFYNTLESIGVQQFQCHEFTDHYDYEIDDLQFEDSNPIVTTEKDAVKLLSLLKKNPLPSEIWVIPVEAVLSEQCYTLLDQQLMQVGIVVDEV